jgi:hypothetical protein
MFHPLPPFGTSLRDTLSGNGHCMFTCTRGNKDNAFRVLRHGWNTVLEPVFALPLYLGTAALGGDQ